VSEPLGEVACADFDPASLHSRKHAAKGSDFTCHPTYSSLFGIWRSASMNITPVPSRRATFRSERMDSSCDDASDGAEGIAAAGVSSHDVSGPVGEQTANILDLPPTGFLNQTRESPPM
jgi:hypothetical protein